MGGRASLFLWFIACATPTGAPGPPPVHAAPEPVQPATGLALLVQQRVALKLSEAQTRRLEALDEALGERNAPLERELATFRAAAKHGDSEEAPRAGGPRGGGGRMGMGGRGRRGMGGAPPGGGGTGGGPAGGGGPQRSGSSGRRRPAEGRAHGGAERADVLRAEMAKNHAAALHDAFEVLDDAQRQRARHLLEENDYEPP
jgi:hypothetical protein